MEPSDKPGIGEVLEHYYDVVVPTGFHGRAKMKCLEHEDRHASASVDHNKNRVRCFACGWAADSIDIIMEQEACDYKAAISIAEDRFDSTGPGLSETASRFGGGSGVSGWQGSHREDNRRRRSRVRRRRRR